MFNYIMNKHKKSVDINFIPNISKIPKSYKKWMKDNMHMDSSTTIRRETKQALNRINIMNEYDRIRGIMDKSIQNNYMDIPRLQDRQVELKRLYHESFYPGIYRGKHDFHK